MGKTPTVPYKGTKDKKNSEIIFTDLDGTLLDHRTYSFKKAQPALNVIKQHHIPLVFCTSKTWAETEVYRRKMENQDPFIVENGGAIYIPCSYFNFQYNTHFKKAGYQVIELGTPYEKLRKVLTSIRKEGLEVIGFGDMSPQEIAAETGLPLKAAQLAKLREYDEPFRLCHENDKQKILTLIQKNNLQVVTGGRYFHLMGDNDKGKAVSTLINLFGRKYGRVTSYGLGDSENDFTMLEAVDRPYLVQRSDGSFASNKYPGIQGLGPEGWNSFIMRIFTLPPVF